MHVFEMVAIIVVVTTFFSTISFLFKTYFANRHKERMALIESGRDMSVFKPKKRQTNRALKFGLLLFGIGAGILTGSIVEFLLGLEPPLGIFAMMFIFGGVALVLYYLIEARHSFEDVEEAFIAPRARKIKVEEDAPFETELRMEERKFDEEEGFDLTQRQH
ncbi:MAG: DUF6249 domain-containing protein [Chitinophagales bacterium]